MSNQDIPRLKTPGPGDKVVVLGQWIAGEVFKYEGQELIQEKAKLKSFHPAMQGADKELGIVVNLHYGRGRSEDVYEIKMLNIECRNSFHANRMSVYLYKPEQFFAGKGKTAFCKTCNQDVDFDLLTVVYIRPYGWMCGICRDEYYANGRIFPSDWDALPGEF